jgi:hypothetical protein
MNAEILIKDEADKFSRYLGKYESLYNGAQEFKNKLTRQLLDYYENIDMLVFLYQVDKNIDKEHDKHMEKCQHKDEPEKCPNNVYYYKCKFFVEQEIRELNPTFDYTILRPNINSDLLRQNLVQLKAFPESGKIFQSALDKLNEGRFERNLLDDLRLSLESTLKAVLDNNKSLEKQLEPLGTFLKQKEASKELTNMFRTMTDYYSKYQNAYVKHNDRVKRNEIELMVNLTSAFINFIINEK